MPKRNKRRSNKQRIDNLTESILKILRQNHSQPYNYKQIASKLRLDDPSSRKSNCKETKTITR